MHSKMETQGKHARVYMVSWRPLKVKHWTEGRGHHVYVSYIFCRALRLRAMVWVSSRRTDDSAGQTSILHWINVGLTASDTPTMSAVRQLDIHNAGTADT